jgi:hypothetical protein
LLSPSGEAVSGEESNDGRGKLTLQIDRLVTEGLYTIRVQAVDRAGNRASASFETSFLFSSSIPVVVSTVPETSPPERAFTNASLSQVEVELQSADGGANRSTITLLASNGTVTPGVQSVEGNRLIYRLSQPLADDGSADGTYTLSVTPVNRAGRRGTPQQFSFVYDTAAPEVDLDTIALIVAEPGVNNALNEIRVDLADASPGSGIDWDNLDESWFTLEMLSPDPGGERKVRGSLSGDEQRMLTFRLTTPLASDGSQDGEYRVTIAPKDRAGNVAEAAIYEFFYDTRPPEIKVDSLRINDQPLLTDPNHPDYPAAVNSVSGVVIQAKLEDVNPNGGRGLGVNLAQSSIIVRAADGSVVNGSLTQNGTDGVVFKSGPLVRQGIYQVTVVSAGLDEANLGFQPTDSLSTQFLYETTRPIAELTDFGEETVLKDKPIPLKGAARDVAGADGVNASGVSLVEIIGTGPGGTPIEPIVAKDESETSESPWRRWSLNFLPVQSGRYNLDIRVTDRAGNVAVYDAVTVSFVVSFAFKAPTYCWPNPLRRSNGDLAHFSFDVNIPEGKAVRMTLLIYDIAGDLVYEKEFRNIGPGRAYDQLMTWNLKNQSGADVAHGVYVFRLEAEDTATGDRTNAVGKILLIE